MTDLVFLELSAGDGGNGRISFRREKYVTKGGPDGGDGGDGGNIRIIATHDESTLQFYSGTREFVAERGQDGGRKNKIGRKAEDLVLYVPVGTIIWQLTENQTGHHRRLLTHCQEALKSSQVPRQQFAVPQETGAVPPREPDLVFDPEKIDEALALPRFKPELLDAQELFTFTEEGQELLLCQGGFGGNGNDHYKSSTERIPLRAEYGSYGEIRHVAFELRLLADVGLVGFPNAGKSTLLSVLTKARPKVGAYPFTTLEPHLGILYDPVTGSEKVLADIPGIIEGAGSGKGLGFEFLRHVSNSNVLLFIFSLDEIVLFDDSLTTEEKAEQLLGQYKTLLDEVTLFDPELANKRRLLSVSKIDLYSAELLDAITTTAKQKSMDLMLFSSATGVGLAELKTTLASL